MLASQHHDLINATNDNLINDMHPLSFATGYAENEVFHLGQMLKQPDRSSFATAMETEINGHNDGKHWKIVRKSEAGTSKMLKSIRSFKRKRNPDGIVTKYKARTCAHGGMQGWGDAYFETHSPVVNWLSVRLLITLSVSMDLDTRSIDFTMAYPQAKLKNRVFMNIPWGFTIEGE